MSEIALSAAEAFGHVPSRFRGIAIEPEREMVGRPCACGEMVWANPADPRPGVTAHNATNCHRAWSEAEGEREAWGEG